MFVETWNFLNESELWSENQIKEFQLRQLNVVISHAYNNVPYYRKVFDVISLNPKDIKDFEDLKEIKGNSLSNKGYYQSA